MLHIMLTESDGDRYITVFKGKREMEKCFKDLVRSNVTSINKQECKSWDVEQEVKDAWENKYFDTFDLSSEVGLVAEVVEVEYGKTTILPKGIY